MKPISPQKWLAVSRTRAWTEQGSRCKYCGSHLARRDVTADHVVPRSAGGTDRDENIVGACRPCDRAKGSLSSDRFRRLIRAEGFPPTPLLSFERRQHINLARVRYRLNRRADLAVKRIYKLVGRKP